MVFQTSIARLSRFAPSAGAIVRASLAGLLSIALLAAVRPAYAQLPTGPNVVNGSATVATSGAQMTVTNTPSAVLNWQSFSIGAANGVHFQQIESASQVLNRVTGNDPSQILGSLTSNGGVWLINPHGVLFGQNARIDVAGLVASTLDISNSDFLANRSNSRFNFAAGGPTQSQVLNQGQIRTSFGGRVWLVGERVQNDGLIETPGGGIVLAAGKSIELVDSGMPHVVVRVNAPENEAVNLGSLIAGGGSIDLHGGIVNQSGIVRADSAGTDAIGQIVLTGSQGVTLGDASVTEAAGGRIRVETGTFNNRGEIAGSDVAVDASEILQPGTIKAPGGSVVMSAQTSTYLDGAVDVSNPHGAGGNIRLTTGKLEGMAGGSLRADGQEGGNIHVEGSGMIGFSSTLSATGVDRGGNIEVTGDSVYLLNAKVDASGGAQGGTVHLGGGWQGGGKLAHAREVLVGVGSEVKANGGTDGSLGQGGRGGEVVVWSTQSSEHYGSLQAKDGGRIELSSQGEIRQTGELQAGPGGSVLFDPKNLIITDSPPDSLALARKVVSGSVSSGQPVLADSDGFGTAVALDGDRLAVGAPLDDTGGTNLGAVHLFTGVGADFAALTWRKKLASGIGAAGMPSLAPAFSQFGDAVALDGDRLAVGVPRDGTGAVHLFTGVGTDFSGLTWQKKLATGIGATNMPALGSDWFGFSIGLNGDRLAVGAPLDSGGGNRGTVHLFTGVGANFAALTWLKQLASGVGAAGMPALAAGDAFGTAVALDGDRLAVGAYLDDTGSTGSVDRGAVHLFTGVGTDFSGLTWQKKLASGIASGIGATGMPALADNDHFGWSVALDGDRLAVGAPVDDTGGTGSVDRGAVHLFTGVGTDFSGLTWQKKLASGIGAAGMPALADNDQLGTAVALDSDRLAVGAFLDDTGGVDRGAVHLLTGVGADFSGLTWQKKLASGIGQPALADSDFFGIAVALDGDRLAVAADFDDTGGTDRGAVHLFTGVGTDFSGLTWQKKLASGTGATNMPALADSDHFGIGVALNGDRLAVGADLDDTGGPSRGAVHLFTDVGTDFSGLTWRKKLASSSGAIGMPALADGDQFGIDMALDGDRLAVGAPNDDTDGINRGAVHLFTGVGADFSGIIWQKKLASDTGATGMPALAGTDNFGNAVALDGDRLAVGAPNDDTGGTDRGAVHLFNGVGTDFSGLTWRNKLASGTGATGMPVLTNSDLFGTTVALDGDRLAVGAPFDDTGGIDRGAVHLLTGVGADFSGLTWQKKLASGTGATGMPALAGGDRFGVAVALDGDRLVVGAELDDTFGTNRGAVYLFTGMSTLGIGVGDATFGTNPGGTSFITPATITSLLNTGTAVTLQANNDITVLSPVIANNASGNGGDLLFQAGRNITFSAGVTTDSGNLTAVAGDPGAIAAFTDTGTPTITLASAAVTLDVGGGVGTLAAVKMNGVIANNGGSLVSTTGGRWLIYAADPATSSNFGFGNKHYDQTFALGIIPSYAPTGNWSFYGVAPTLAVTPSSQTMTYGGALPDFSPSYTGFIDGDTDLTSGIGGAPIWAVGGATSSSGNLTAGSHDVSYSSGLLSGLGYQFADNTGSNNELAVSPATLVYEADPATGVIGVLVTDLTGLVTGFKPTDTQTNATTGVLQWTTPATIASPAGFYPIDGSGLSAANYVFAQASGNATALALSAPITPPPKQQEAINASIDSIADAQQAALSIVGSLTLHVPSVASSLAPSPEPSFTPVTLSLLSSDELKDLLDSREEYKKKIFGNALYKLVEDPSLAEVRPCLPLADVDSGLCRMTDEQRAQVAQRVTHRRPRARVATLPQIDRKIAVLFGINRYADKTIPELDNPLPDADAVGKLLAEKLGYEVRVVRNPSKADIVRTLNRISTEVEKNDSVIVYYAGHGYLIDKTGIGYWIPADASASDPAGWISNTDISKMLADIDAKQLVMISDSCYSGAFTREQGVLQAAGQVKPEDVLTKRSVVVMSSGGNEPVADGGKDGHSVFAWYLMQNLRSVDKWQPGSTIFEEVRRDVRHDLPQTPQYGAAVSAGHEAGGEYLFEFRQLQ